MARFTEDGKSGLRMTRLEKELAKEQEPRQGSPRMMLGRRMQKSRVENSRGKKRALEKEHRQTFSKYDAIISHIENCTNDKRVRQKVDGGAYGRLILAYALSAVNNSCIIFAIYLVFLLLL